MQSLHEIVRRAEKNLLHGETKLGEHVDWSLHKTVERIFAYLNSRHEHGLTDSLGRDKPFFNIVTAAVNIWYRATDIDRKDIVVLPDKSTNTVAALMATILLQDWMKKTRFGVFLNQWGRTLAQYGSAVVKFVERDGELVAQVVPWNRLIVDPIDFNALPRIEKFYKTAQQLKDMATKGHPNYAGYNMTSIESLLDAQQTRETMMGEHKDNQNEFIELYEVHGELSQATYKDSKGEDYEDADEEIFFQQMHVISSVKGKDGIRDFALYCGKEKKDPYMITHLIEEEGRTLSIGAVESLFDAQWMQNHTMKAWKDQMDLASKLVFQTADERFVGKNALNAFETGAILYHEQNQPIEPFPNSGHDITNLQAFSNQWRVLEREVTSTPDAARGTTPPSGTALGTVQIVTAQGLSLFEIMTENKAHALEEMLRVHIVPHLKTKMDTQEEVIAILEDHNLQKIDSMYIPRAAIKNFNDRVKESLFNKLSDFSELKPFNPEEEEAGVRSELAQFGNQRAFSPGEISWKEALKDLEWKLDVGITNEQHDKQAVLQSLNILLQTIATNPMVLQDPNGRLLFNKILGFTNIVSPVELSAVAAAPAPAPVLAS